MSGSFSGNLAVIRSTSPRRRGPSESGHGAEVDELDSALRVGGAEGAHDVGEVRTGVE